MARAYLFLAVATSLLHPAVARAQEVPAPQAADAPAVVVITEKSPFAAGALEYLIPTAGYAYAGNWGRGVVPGLVRIAGAVLWFEDQFTVLGDPPPCRTQCSIGLIMAVGATAWGIVDAVATAGRTNETRRAAARQAAVLPTVGPLGAGVAVRVPFGK